MALREIARMGHPVLQKVAEMVADPTAPEIAALIADMVETMRAADGVGLAAPQIGVSKRILVFEVPGGTDGEDAPQATDPQATDPQATDPQATDPQATDPQATDLPVGLTCLINPVLEPIGEAMALGVEGCLSLPGMVGMVPRYVRLRYHGVTPQGQRIQREVSGFHARVVQHEADHLDGILYPMRMKDLSTFGYIDEMEKSFPEL